MLLLLHGLIHLMGFVKAFQFAAMDALSSHITRPQGMLWLLACLLFLVTSIALLDSWAVWWMFSMAAISLSQFLIFRFWQDAKFGTIANVIILLITIPAVGKYQFYKMVQKETVELKGKLSTPPPMVYGMDELKHLPPIVQIWLENAGLLGRSPIIQGSLQQTGQIKTSPEGTWMPFQAEQFFNFQQPGFVWSTEVQMQPCLYLLGRDRFQDGEGNMSIKLLSLFTVADEGPNDAMNTAAMLRFLAEICWFPPAAMSPYLRWEEIDEQSAKVAMKYAETEVSGVFHFSERGDIRSFTAQRYFGSGAEARQEKWVVTALGYQVFEGYKVPSQCKVTWQLPEGDFEWLHLSVTGLSHQ